MTKKLFVDQTIEVKASRAAVWRVITDPGYTKQWAPEFTNGAPLDIESTWDVGGEVLWKDKNGTVIVEGEVTACEKNVLLRFTVFAANAPHVSVTPEDGITWRLTEKKPHTTIVRVRQGDFGPVEAGEEKHHQTEKTWSRILPKVKELAETLG